VIARLDTSASGGRSFCSTHDGGSACGGCDEAAVNKAIEELAAVRDRPRKANVWWSGCQVVIMVGAALALLTTCCGIAVLTLGQ
jgi:hypothetical protein